MDKENALKGTCKLQLNSISKVEDDPLLEKMTFSIIDFEVNGNSQIIDKKLAIESAPTLKGKPLLCMYTPSTDKDSPNDHFGDHGEAVKTDRYGNEYIGSNTIAIGTALDGGYIATIKDKDNNDKEALCCDFYVWQDRNVEIVQLIHEMHDNGLPLYSSCEYWFFNYEVNDGVTTMKSPIYFSGHVILDSGENGSTPVPPAYDSSKLLSLNERWNKAMSKAIKNKENSSKEVNGLSRDKDSKQMFKKICELSFGDIQSQLYEQLRNAVSDNEYDDAWITEVYNDYFIVSYWFDNGDSHKYFKVSYTKSDDSVTIDWDNKKEVILYQEWREIPEVQNTLNELEQAKKKVNEITKQLNQAKEEKANVVKQFNEASGKVTSLNAKVQEMTPIVEKYNKEVSKKAVNEKLDYYQNKFKAVDALDKFESDEVQNLIKKSTNSDDEGKEATLSLNTILVDLVQVTEKDDKKPAFKEVASKQDNLIPTGIDFDSRYGI